MVRPTKHNPIKIGDIFLTDRFGNCEVTHVQGNGTTGNYATVKFLNTGNIKNLRISVLRSGAVLDKESPLYSQPAKPCKYTLPKLGDVFSTNSGGDCKIISFEGNGMSRNLITVKFLSTGYITKARHSELRKGQVRNRNNPSVYGIGFLGDGTHKANDPAYDLWYAVLQRCYSTNYHNKQTERSYSNVEVCKEWHNYQNFADFYTTNYIDGYQLDKDILDPGCKLYSPDTCMFIPRSVNNTEALLRTLVDEDPSYRHVLEVFYQHTLTRYKSL